MYSSVATHWLPRVISGFLEDHPGIGYELMLGDYAEIAEWVREGRTPLLVTRRFLEHVDLNLGFGEPPANDGAIG